MSIKGYRNLLMILFSVLLFSCGKSKEKEKAKDKGALFLSKITYDSIVPSDNKSMSVKQVYAVNSFPVNPKTFIDIVNNDTKKAIVSKVKVAGVRWKVPGPFQTPKYPAKGFVSVSLANNQWDAIKKVSNISIVPSQNPDNQPTPTNNTKDEGKKGARPR